MVAGSLTYDTKMDTSGFQKGIDSITSKTQSGGTKIKNIVAALGITRLISSGINVVMGSLDSAISRLDILNNYPKVMSNLGIETDKAQNSINKMSDKLSGLPTTLDSAALSVQRFTSANGDIEKSTEYFLALNNALLAGGANAGIQETAMEQLSQAYAKGKPDMMEWRSILTAMPAQLKQVATAMGYVSTDKLGEDLRNGKVSMTEFMDTIVRLNNEGIEGFQNFEMQARNSTDGIATSLRNAKTAISRGVANVISGINDALRKTELQSVSNIISKIGKTVENVLKRIGKAISRIDLNLIIKRLKEIITVYGSRLKTIVTEIVKRATDLWNIIKRNKSAVTSLISVVLGLVAAYKSYQLILKAIQAINIVSSIVGALNPIALLVAGITALTVAVGLSVTAIDKQKRSMGGLKEEAEAQQISWNNLKKAREESLSNSLMEIATTQKLADELRQITDENGKVKEGYENRAKYILGELNKALGTEYTLNGNIISQYEELKNNIDSLILSKRAEATLNSFKSEYETALTKQTEATKTLTELRQKYNEELNRSTEGYQDEMKKARDLEYIGKQIKEQTNLIGEYGYTVQNYENLTSASVSGNADEIKKAIDSMGVSYEEAKNKVNSSLNEQINSQSNYVNLLNKSWQEAVSNNDKYQAQILEKQLETQNQELSNLAKSLATQTSTVENLTQEQIDAWSNLAGKSITAYNDGLSSLDADTKKKVEEATGILVEETEFPNGAKGLAYKAVDGFKLNFNLDGSVSAELDNTNDILIMDKKVKSGAETLADNANEGFNDNVDGKEWGSDLASNISGGMTSQKSKSGITNAASTVAGWISSFLHFSVPDTGPLSDFDESMPDMIKLMTEGISKNKYKVLNAVQGLSSDMERELQNAVNLEVGKMNTTATIRSNNMFNNVIQLNAKLDGTVEMDKRTTGQILAPEITKTIKVGGLA